ncbi:protein grindelwald isoform X1 [Cotesia glomerata]|nr:protein grindelwald isoform X1 [Cotesia glomerata]
MTLLNLFLVFILAVGISEATLDPVGTKCGEYRCSTSEYCSRFDSQCKPCSSICDSKSHNRQLDLCVTDCQEYLHDQRYVLRAEPGRDENLREDVQRLGSLVKISLALTLITILAIIIFLIQTVVKFKRIRSALEKLFGKKWAKNNNNKVRTDVEAVTVVKPASNAVISTLPTISAAVSPPSSASQGSDSKSNSNGSSTPDTTSTNVSRKYASEDTTLEFAYDNPAMTPSPENLKDNFKSKHESSF